jgi:hypothetical protein
MSAALARAQDFLLEPAPPRPTTPAPLSVGRLEAIVLGMRSGSGASTLARGLAAALESMRAAPVHLLSLGGSRSRNAPLRGGALGGGSHWEVPADLEDSEAVAEYGRMVARLAGERAALVWGVPPRELGRAAAAASRAHAVIAVAPGSGEPALAEVVRGMLAERFEPVVLVANNVSDPARWSGRADVCVPASRWGALLSARGRRPAGAFGAALEELTALVAAQPSAPAAASPEAPWPRSDPGG